MTDFPASASSGARVSGAARGRVLAVGTLVAVALAVAACGSSSSSPGTTAAGASSTSPTAHSGTTPSSTSSTSKTGSTTATTGATATTGPTASTAPGSVVVAAASRGGLGVILTDGVGGPTLYRYTPDGTGPSTCSGECAQAWPPLTAASASAVTAGSGVPAADLGTVARSGGSLQVTYKGMPLYTYVGDTQPSQTSGQGVGGVWYVVVPTDPARASPSP